ncbi:hypothetical protein [Schaalia suimastitidis]|uniref:hypothetical protein n=1 Tax=Schaalia suimastitidis TaxID=121163 RepID=UPI000421DB70|nr:hypothetical protein [Schaalia suimastitidis]
MSNPYAASPENTPEGAPSQSASWAPESAPQPAQPAQPTYGQPAYGQPAYAPAPAYAANGEYVDVASLKSNATVAFVLAILGLIGFLPLIGSIIGWVWGGNIVKKAAAAGVPESEVSMAKYARIMGMIGTILAAIGIVLIVIFFIVGVLAMMSNPELINSVNSL